MTNSELNIYKTTTSLRIAVDNKNISEVIKFLRELKLEMENQAIKNKNYNNLLSELNDLVDRIETQEDVLDMITDRQAKEIDRLIHLVNTFYLQHGHTQRTEQSVDVVRKERDFYKQMLVYYSKQVAEAAEKTEETVEKVEEFGQEYNQLRDEIARSSKKLEEILAEDVPEYEGPSDETEKAINDALNNEEAIEKIRQLSDRLSDSDSK